MQACREARSGGESGSQQPEVFEGMCEDFATALARPFVSRHDHFNTYVFSFELSRGWQVVIKLN